MNDSLAPIVEQRQRRYLETFSRKIAVLKKDLGRLASQDAGTDEKSSRKPQDSLKRQAQGLLNAGPVYDLPSVSAWAKEFIALVEDAAAVSGKEKDRLIASLHEKIEGLEALQRNLLEAMGVDVSESGPAVEPVRPDGDDSSQAPGGQAPRSSPAPFDFGGPGDLADRISSVLKDDERDPDGTERLQSFSGVAWSNLAAGHAAEEKAPSEMPGKTTEQSAGTPTPAVEPHDTQRDTESLSLSDVVEIPDGGERAEPPEISIQKPPPVHPDDEPAADALQVEFTVAIVDPDPATMEAAQGALKPDLFSVRQISGPDRAHSEIVDLSPDIILLDPTAGGNLSVLNGLARDPLTSVIPVVLVGGKNPGSGVSWIPKPIDLSQLDSVVFSSISSAGPPQEEAAVEDLRVLNLDGLVDFIGSELRHGLIETAYGPGHGRPFPLKSRAEVLASTWSLVAVARNAVHNASRGEIKFLPSSRGGLGLMALSSSDEVPEEESEGTVSRQDLSDLAGISVLVADDDVEIREIFQKVLAGAGMKVSVAADGEAALAKIRSSRPDVVISDILMPKMDGWELLSRMRQDFTLRFIPVIMISWKEDFIQRLEELSTEADGYLRKEVEQKQILERIAGVLKPRLFLERRLAEGMSPGIAGRIERLGIITIVDTVRKLKPQSMIRFRDNYGTYEAHIFNGELVNVVKPGQKADIHASPDDNLERLLAMSVGRFSVEVLPPGRGKVFSTDTNSLFEKAAVRMNKLVSLTASGAILRAKRIDLDPLKADSYRKVVPAKLATTVEILSSGTKPRDLVLSSRISPRDIESLVMDLIRRGVVKDIEPLAGEEIEDLDELKLARMDHPKPPDLRQSIESKKAAARDARVKSGEGKTILQKPALAVAMGLGVLVTGIIVGWLLSMPGRQLPADTAVTAALPAAQKVNTLSEHVEQETVGEAVQDRAPEAEPEPEPEPEPEAEEEEPVKLGEMEIRQEPEKPSAAKKKKVVSPYVEKEAPAAVKKREAEPEPEPEPVKKPPAKQEPAKASAKEPVKAPEKKAEKKPEAQAPAPAPKPPPASVGTLVINKQPGVNEPVKVFIDGRSYGTAPLKLQLKPGLHEIKFVVGSASSLRMVMVAKGITKRVTPNVQVP